VGYGGPGGVLVVESLDGAENVWQELPVEVRQAISEKKLHFYVIDAHKVATATGMGGRINTIMQTCFFAISGILPKEEAIEQIKKSIRKSYSKRGEAVVQRNFQAVDETLAHLYEVKVPIEVGAGHIQAHRAGIATQQRTPI